MSVLVLAVAGMAVWGFVALVLMGDDSHRNYR